MTKRRRYSEAEISFMLDQAHEMAVQGKSHGEIVKALGISAMTYHRWRKARAGGSPAQPFVDFRQADALTVRDQVKRIGELQFENSRLRRLIADLLLEKMKLVESLRGDGSNHGGSG